MTSRLLDREIRAVLARRLEGRDATVRHEMPLCLGVARIDMAVVGSRFEGFEIKSEWRLAEPLENPGRNLCAGAGSGHTRCYGTPPATRRNHGAGLVGAVAGRGIELSTAVEMRSPGTVQSSARPARGGAAAVAG